MMPPTSNERNTVAALTVSGIAISSIAVYAFSRLRQQQSKKEEYQRRASNHEMLVACHKHERKRRESLIVTKVDPTIPLKGTLLNDVKIDEVYLWEVEHLNVRFPSEAPEGLTNHMAQTSYDSITPSDSPTFTRSFGNNKTPLDSNQEDLPSSNITQYNQLIGTHECILGKILRKPGTDIQRTTAYVRAGPRPMLHFDPATVNAAIVTCGGLCPGLNNVIREITNSLIFSYGVKGKIWGIQGGFKGFYDSTLPAVELTASVVEDIHHQGGTVLGSSRGGFDFEKILKFIKEKDIKQLYVIGGDGTHRGAFKIHEGCMKQGMNVSVAGIPKTIDNDVDYIDRSFGFESAVEAAQDAIRCAKIEASCNLPNGIGIVKLMGRSSGFIAAFSTLCSGDVDLCLVPEVPLILDGEHGCLPHLYRTVKQKGFAVVVVAEGAGEEVLGESMEKDASGNKKLPAIGEFMKKSIEAYFKSLDDEATVKYIDPSYMVRSVPANASDSLYCMQLAQNAVHGSMAGFTGFSVGLCNNKMVLLPIPYLVSTSPRMMNSHGRTWERVLSKTRQPNTVVPKRERLDQNINTALSV